MVPGGEFVERLVVFFLIAACLLYGASLSGLGGLIAIGIGLTIFGLWIARYFVEGLADAYP